MDFVPKTNWQNKPSTATPITAEELLRIEAGISEGARDASELQKGNVELASPAEMTAGNDLTKVPSVVRVKDYVAAQIAAALGTIPSASPASETAAGVVELATTGEMTTGTDTPLRVPSVAKVAAYVTSAINTLSASINASLAGKADKSGSVAQFADIADTTPDDSDVLRYETDTNLWQPSSLAGQYAGLDVNSRLAPTAYPQYYVPILVLNEGVTVPSGTPTSTIILRRATTASITPVLLGGVATSSLTTTCAITTSADVNVGDYLIIGWFGSGETPAPTTFSISITGGTGALSTPLNDTAKHLQGSTAQSAIIFARCTTQIPAGRGITLTVDDSRGAMGMTVCKASALLSTPASVLSTSSGLGNTGTAVSATAGATSQASELALFMTSFNPGLTDQRTISGTNGWAAIDIQRNSHGTNDRSGRLFYKELTSVVTAPPGLIGTATINNGTETSNSVWSAVVASLKAQG